MKIGVLSFPIGKVGGIFTNAQNLEKGFNQLGHTVEKYFISLNTHSLPKNNEFGWSVLGFEKQAWYEEYLNTINKLDLVIWEVCCPHLIKSYTTISNLVNEEMEKQFSSNPELKNDPKYKDKYFETWNKVVKEKFSYDNYKEFFSSVSLIKQMMDKQRLVDR